MPKKYAFKKTFTYEGKRYVVYADSEKQLYKKMYDKQRALEEGKVTVSDNMLVSDWAKVAIDSYKRNLNKKGREDMLLRVNKHILSRIGSQTVKSIKPIQCQALMNALEGYSWSTVQKVYQDLQFIFRTALQNHLILDNPAKDVVRPAAIKGQRQAIKGREREIFLKVVDGVDKFRVFELMFYCGCRPAEAIKCQGSDLSVKDGVALLHVRGTKTKNSDRIVPMPDELYQKVKNVGPFEPLAPNSSGRFHSESSYNRCANDLKRQMNIAMGCRTYRNALIPPYPLRESFVPYDLRHTYCSDLARRGIDIRVAQKLMGHSSISITADIYTHVQDEQILDDAAQILGKVSQGITSGVTV
ncbi:tyrosine-type recombinase/integrase [Pseudobutyrivibrio ruminis]|uniref:Tyr recombinase domain-containing protein n=1 Tax=Pseudobutyrivibrio ruminis TaxID=46206 RepID=A0A2G3DYK7_9FIRM|nr:site-specific integrase [Pseudobutyrivibrio ruminis]PHU36041.1 hypothetical protein CSX01_02050 [Pseudobutyrivibrio ruminis]